MNTYIDFNLGSTLAEATKWVYDTDPKLTEGCALKHTLYVQEANDFGTIKGCGLGDVWLTRKVLGQGVIGTEILFDGEDIISRLPKGNLWKSHALRVSPTKHNSIKLDCITGVDATGQVLSSARITVSCYKGDLSDFAMPELTLVPLATINPAFAFRQFCSQLSSFSELRTDNSNRLARLRFEPGLLKIYVPEQRSDLGISIARAACEIQVAHEAFSSLPFHANIQGRYLHKIADVFTYPEVKVSLSPNYTNPEFICFKGDLGSVTLPLQPDYLCRALSSYAEARFNDSEDTEFVSSAVFEAERLLSATQVHVPKKKATSNDIVIEIANSNLNIYKLVDLRKEEESFVPLAELFSLKGTFCSIVLKHNYFSDALELITKYIIQKKKEDSQVPEDSFFDEEDYKAALSNEDLKGTLLRLTQRKRVKNGLETWLLEVSSNEDDPPCRVIMTAQLKSTMTDLDESEDY